MTLQVEPEVHVLGELAGGAGFETDNAFCVYSIGHGKEWTLVGGDEKGQTQVDYPQEDDMCVWNHPLDLHYYTKTLQGWPKLVMEIWKLDEFGQRQLFGYGFTYFPSKAGSHELEVPVWRPCGNRGEEIYDFYVGGTPHLISTELVHNTTTAKEERCRLYTKTVGKVFLNLEVVLRNMKPHKVKT